MPLTHIGLWSRLGGLFPHPLQLKKSRLDPTETERIAKYVEDSPRVNITHRNPFSTTFSLIEHDVALGLGLRSDGVWLYPEGYAHYIRHGIAIPSNFVDHVRKCQYQPLTDPIHDEAIGEDYGHAWIWWSLAHSRLTWRLPLTCVLFLFQYPARQLLWPFFTRVKVV